MTTINKRETSFEGLIGQFENGEDGIYNLVKNDKNIIFQPKVTITKKDIEEIPPLRELRETIEKWEKLQTLLKLEVTLMNLSKTHINTSIETINRNIIEYYRKKIQTKEA